MIEIYISKYLHIITYIIEFQLLYFIWKYKKFISEILKISIEILFNYAIVITALLYIINILEELFPETFPELFLEIYSNKKYILL